MAHVVLTWNSLMTYGIARLFICWGVCSGLCPFFFLILKTEFWIKVLYEIHVCQYFLSVCNLSVRALNAIWIERRKAVFFHLPERGVFALFEFLSREWSLPVHSESSVWLCVRSSPFLFSFSGAGAGGCLNMSFLLQISAKGRLEKAAQEHKKELQGGSKITSFLLFITEKN